MRKIKYISASIVLVAVIGCAVFRFGPAAQVVKGTMAQDTVWRGVVEVAKDVVVLPGVTLKIEPGTTVRFKGKGRGKVEPQFLFPEVELLVQGNLVAEGTAEAPIVFTPTGDGHALGDWAGIILDNTTEPPSVIKHCRIEYARTAIFCIGASPIIESNTLIYNQQGVICQQDSHPGIVGNEIAYGELGIASWNNSTPRIISNHIHHQEQAGIMWGRGAAPHLEHNIIEENRYGVFGAEPLSQLSKYKTSNQIQKNRQDIYSEVRQDDKVIR